MSKNEYIERHIIIGLITSTEYLHEIRHLWNPRFIESETARRLSDWCLEYYDKYQKAPGRAIEVIYFDKLKAGLPKDLAEELEEDILPDLSEEYERADKFNVQYLLDQTYKYFDERNLEIWETEIRDLREQGEIEQADSLARNYKPISRQMDHTIDLSHPDSIPRIERAFDQQSTPLLKYPGALGSFLNPHLVREGFVAFMASEKRGKSYWMLDMARRGVQSRLNVAFFQAGDMSESQQLRRLAIHLAKRSDSEIYTGKMWEPVKDCIHNQADTCDLRIRESKFGLEGEHAPRDEEHAREGLELKKLKELFQDNPKYKPCWNCKKYQSNPWGCSWIKPVEIKTPLQKEEAVKIFKQYFIKKKRRFRISTHPNNSLSVSHISKILDNWWRQGFAPDIILVDYADLLVAESREFRHKQDEIWKSLRALSEERHALVVTATQADAKSYSTGLLDLSNFSEDKRKYAHVTAMFGLNQDPGGREKEIGITRLNILTVREGESNVRKVAHVLQNLKRGQPVLTSYW